MMNNTEKLADALSRAGEAERLLHLVAFRLGIDSNSLVIVFPRHDSISAESLYESILAWKRRY
jgi:hypothetical protein